MGGVRALRAGAVRGLTAVGRALRRSPTGPTRTLLSLARLPVQQVYEGQEVGGRDGGRAGRVAGALVRLARAAAM